MKTKQVYYEDPYKTELKTTILEIQEGSDSLQNIILTETIFFPEGGGQTGDRGEIVGKNGNAKIEYTRTMNDEIVHQGKINGELKKGDKVVAKIDWNWRYKYMKIHTAGHLIHDVFMTLAKGLTPQKGSHGSKAFLEYSGTANPSLKETLQQKVGEEKEKGLPIITKETTVDELNKECHFIPANLPKDKKLRMIKIGDCPSMPDGGVHVKTTKEIGGVAINELSSGNDLTIIKYRVFGEE